MTHAAEKGH